EAQPPLLENGGEWTPLATNPIPLPASQPMGHFRSIINFQQSIFNFHPKVHSITRFDDPKFSGWWRIGHSDHDRTILKWSSCAISQPSIHADPGSSRSSDDIGFRPSAAKQVEAGPHPKTGRAGTAQVPASGWSPRRSDSIGNTAG